MKKKNTDPISILKYSRQVHSTWYREQYPDVDILGMHPAEHYLKYGAVMGRNPGKKFDTQFYLESYPEVAATGMNPLLHYILYGEKQGYEARPQNRIDRLKRKIDAIRLRLHSLGFVDRPLRELEELMSSDEPPVIRASAARELALWHMLTRSPEGWEKALFYVGVARNLAPDVSFRSAVTVIELLCLYFLGRTEEGKAAYKRAALSGEVTPDVMLANVNFQSTPEARVAWINQVLSYFDISPLRLLDADRLSSYDRLTSAHQLPKVSAGPCVSVIVAAYCADATLSTALRSLQEQTWENLEIIVVDDGSSDPKTYEIASSYAQHDTRIRVIRLNDNSGAYVARNCGLDEAKGEYVTIHDADDWSHPTKIERQVRYLEQHPEVVACTSEQARCWDDLSFGVTRRKGELNTSNTSSLMFRRSPVVRDLGYWDTVRFGADGELMWRLKKQFGNEALVHIPTGPLSFQRVSDGSATEHAYFGYQGFKFGVRRIYEEIFKVRNSERGTNRYDNNRDDRPFYAPRPMRSLCSQKKVHYDVIIASDFRFPGGTSSSNAEEVKAQRAAGLRTGLLELFDYELKHCPINTKIVELLESDKVEFVTWGEKVSCDVLIIRQPLTLNERQVNIPDVYAKDIRVIINQTPKRDYADGSRNIFDLGVCAENVERYFGGRGKWHPIGPLVREALHRYHAEELSGIDLQPDDWVNIINIDEWRRDEWGVDPGRPIRICRHSRDSYVKWPADRTTLLKAYPDAPDFEIHVLGGGGVPANILGGQLPKNWRVIEFGQQDPRRFLADKDIFVYFTHPNWIEAFGRVIFEAMCAGVPVILPAGLGYEKLFGDAAIYTSVDNVATVARSLARNPKMYREQVSKALEIMHEKFSYSTHIERIRRCTGG